MHILTKAHLSPVAAQDGVYLDSAASSLKEVNFWAFSHKFSTNPPVAAVKEGGVTTVGSLTP